MHRGPGLGDVAKKIWGFGSERYESNAVMVGSREKEAHITTRQAKQLIGSVGTNKESNPLHEMFVTNRFECTPSTPPEKIVYGRLAEHQLVVEIGDRCEC